MIFPSDKRVEIIAGGGWKSQQQKQKLGRPEHRLQHQTLYLFVSPWYRISCRAFGIRSAQLRSLHFPFYQSSAEKVPWHTVFQASVWLQKHCASSHTTTFPMEFVCDAFFSMETHFSIRKYFWPPWSPDLTVPNVLKARVFQTCPAINEELKTNIWEEIDSTSQQELQKAKCNSLSRVKKFIAC